MAELQKAGISFRVRKEAGRRTQTIKRKTGAAVVLRDECECELSSDEQSPKPTGDDAIDRLINNASDQLKPFAYVNVDRWIRKVNYDGATIILSIDSGRVEAQNTTIGDVGCSLSGCDASG